MPFLFYTLKERRRMVEMVYGVIQISPLWAERPERMGQNTCNSTRLTVHLNDT